MTCATHFVSVFPASTAHIHFRYIFGAHIFIAGFSCRKRFYSVKSITENNAHIMRLEILIILVTAAIMYNTHTDGKYIKQLFSYKKYWTIAFYGAIGLGACFLLRCHPARGREMLYCAGTYAKYLPIDKSSMGILSPIIDFTRGSGGSGGGGGFMQSVNNEYESGAAASTSTGEYQTFSQGTLPFAGGVGVGTGDRKKRVVSETKKKYVASNQDWKCGHCRNQLDHTFEIDHRIRLEYGGGNDVQNLVALCRNCHGKKTAGENM